MRPRDALIEIGRRLWARGYVAANDGNLSVRLGSDRYLLTRAGSIKGFLNAQDLLEVDGAGRVVSGEGRASSEHRMHLAIYEVRPDVGAIVHAHPVTATGFATAGIDLEPNALPEIVATLGRIPTVPYATPSTDALADAIRAHAGTGNACLLANHGVVTYDGDPFAAYHHMERVEHLARILITARLLGGARTLSAEDVAALRAAIDRG